MLIALMVFIQCVKLFHPHDLIHTGKGTVVYAANKALTTPGLHGNTNLATDRSCSICDFHYLKDVHHYIASFQIQLPRFISVIGSQATCSITDNSPRDIALRGPPALA